ncbi:hypothetical protein F4777DRAFT_579473 [Nemania sp. FL0916]|nr:hypothetical protein F4777DRAFT_579473 [Nemania sp. FL0916]
MSAASDVPPTPSSSNDLGRGPGILGGTWFLTILTITVVSTRIYVRRKFRILGLDDWLMVVAVALQITSQGILTYQYQWGFGKRDKYLSFDPQIVTILKYQWISSIPNILVSVIARISAVLMLINLFGAKIWLKYYLIIQCILQSIAATETILVVWLSVSPVEGLWNPRVQARRLDPHIQSYSKIVLQSLFALSDLTYVLFPVLIIFKLNMPLRRKIGLAALLAMSLLTLVASVLKLATLQAPPQESEDVQYNASIAVVWSTIESSFVIIMASIPPLRPIVALDVPWIRSITSSFKNLFSTSKRSDNSGRHSGSAYPNYHSGYRDLEMVHERNPNIKNPPYANEGILRQDEFEIRTHRVDS